MDMYKANLNKFEYIISVNYGNGEQADKTPLHNYKYTNYKQHCGYCLIVVKKNIIKIRNL